MSLAALITLGPLLLVALAFDVLSWSVVLLYLGFFVALAIARPEVAVFVSTFLIFTNSSMIAAEAVSIGFITEAILLLLLAVVINDFRQRRALPVVLLRAVPAFGLYVLIIAATIFVTVDVVSTREGLVQIIKTAILASVLICVVNSSSRFAAATAGILGAASFLSLLTIYQASLGAYGQEFLGYAKNHILFLDGEVSTLRFGGPVGEPNYYAQILLLAYPIGLSMALAGAGKLYSLVFFGMSGLFATAIILTQSRGGFICLLALSILALKPSLRAILLMIGAISLLGLLLAPLVPAEFSARGVAAFSDIRAIVSGYGSILDAAIAGRVSEMLAAWHLFLERPWLGFGYGTFEGLYQDTARRHDLMARGADRQAHSLYLEILAETGLAGFLAFALMIGSAVYSAGVAARRFVGPLGSAAGSGLALSILGYLVSSFFLHEAFQLYLWTIVALAAVAPTLPQPISKVAIAHADK